MVKGLPYKWGTYSRTVTFDNSPMGLTCWKDSIAVGLQSGKIITLSGTTGSQTAILSGHTNWVRSLTFSSDGRSLVSGSDDMTIKLWDTQTGGVVKTFCGHTHRVNSVSISADCTMIASGSDDCTIRLWDTQTGECNHIMKQQAKVEYIILFQYLISASGNKVQQWDIDGYLVKYLHGGSRVAFSLDGTQLVLYQGADIVVQNFSSGAIVAKIHMPNCTPSHCCFSPDGGLVAVAAGSTVYIWDITRLDPYLVETFDGHTHIITSIVFLSPSSLITSSHDKSVKFWQMITPPTDPALDFPKPTPLASASIKSITLQAKDGIFVSSDLDGIVRIWDILTGLCKTSIQTPAKVTHQSDVQLVNGRLVLVWYTDEAIHIWDVEKEKLLRTIPTTGGNIIDIRLSGDGSKVFCLQSISIEVWSTWTGEVVGRVEVEVHYVQASLIINGSRVWVHSPQSPAGRGWDFGIPGSSPIQIPSLYLSDTKLWDGNLSRIRDVITGKVILQMGGRFAKPVDVQLDGCYFLACYQSGEVLILDFNHVLIW